MVRVPVSSLRPARSPRQDGEDQAHVRMLAESAAVLPPIIVHRSSMRVIDGMHRLRATIMRGQDAIDARLYDGDDQNAFVLAVQANVSHGLPLAATDRREAAGRIMESHPDWSDRMIASVVGLGPTTVRTIRSRSTARSSQSNKRIGRDGRVRPTNGAAGRQLASELMAADPAASLREIAKAAGVSLSTAHDVRHRMQSGLDPIRPKQRRLETGSAVPVRPAAPPPADGPPQLRSVPAGERHAILRALRHDPSLRFSETGRTLLRWLEADLTDPCERDRVIDAIPPHWTGAVAALARANAAAWAAVAERLDLRDRVSPAEPPKRTGS
ncbi:MAG: ParB/RepB/Spo0J family partition protein [Pseudonocardiaceae bacterium]|nr:ParB/RepB/Spo0J family partition protein [Pseudonocardiaceae bacterium]